jgi:hypothetical protein
MITCKHSTICVSLAGKEHVTSLLRSIFQEPSTSTSLIRVGIIRHVIVWRWFELVAKCIHVECGMTSWWRRFGPMVVGLVAENKVPQVQLLAEPRRNYTSSMRLKTAQHQLCLLDWRAKVYVDDRWSLTLDFFPYFESVIMCFYT